MLSGSRQISIASISLVVSLTAHWILSLLYHIPETPRSRLIALDVFFILLITIILLALWRVRKRKGIIMMASTVSFLLVFIIFVIAFAMVSGSQYDAPKSVWIADVLIVVSGVAVLVGLFRDRQRPIDDRR